MQVNDSKSSLHVLSSGCTLTASVQCNSLKRYVYSKKLKAEISELTGLSCFLKYSR